MTEPLTLWHLAWPFTTLSFLLYWTWKAAWGLLRPFLSRHPVLVSWEFCGFLNYPRILRCLWLPSFLKGTLSWLSPRHLWSMDVSAVTFYSWWLWIILFHTIILSDTIKPLPQVGSELGETRGRHVSVLRKLPDRSEQANTVICGSTLLCSLWNRSPGPQTRNAGHVWSLLWAREVVGRASKNGTQLSYFQVAFFWFSIRMVAAKLCLLESWQLILTVSAFFFFFFPGNGESLELSTPRF